MGGDLTTLDQKIADDIREYGWHCLHVFPTQDGQDCFTYSIGFSESYGAPEVLIFGLERQKAHSLLDECARLFRDGHAISPDIEDPNILAGGYMVVFRPVRQDCFREYLGGALRHYRGRPFGAVVMFLPDREHRFPWQPGYDYIPADEPLAIV
ncbi:hypothetical protein J2X06_001252 [Lysobacter niastensis]|uniref:DUF4262 domain-containing protein n=1 Tax=Lysobacter niastensis TaxID=380629 RepID=A0ABU1W900_9GAMM|nr:DUF4262 domain-containing protein [Lysobacter niastensis]MDR7134068.1 hypothetical protein [Lysobacter niastensis]